MNLRKLALTLHVIASVGWIGAVASFLALAVTGLVNPELERVRASYVAMDLTYRWIVIPLGCLKIPQRPPCSPGTQPVAHGPA
jgi:hypothetical protein